MSRSCMRSTRWLLASLALAITAPLACADKLILVDGREFEGEVVEETSKQVKFKARQGAIITTLTFKRFQIASIERSEVSDRFLNQGNALDDDGSTETPSEIRRSAGDATHYLRIPIRGVMGEESFAVGIEKALARARRSKIDHVVFDIDTPGVFLHEARTMVDVIEEFRAETQRRGQDVKIYAYVHNAISAGIWVMFSCDEIFFERTGTAGGAVGFTTDNTTGAAEVDAKLNSIVAADLAASAEALGHEGKVIRAMIIMDAELWARASAAGNVQFMEPPPAGDASHDYEELDSRATVLTLTAAQAQRLGVGTIVPGGHEALGDHLGIEGWTVAGNIGEAAMLQARREAGRVAEKRERERTEAVDLAKDMENLNKSVYPRLIDRAQNLDPASDRYTVFRDSGYFTGESLQRWRTNHDRCITAWNDVVRVLKKMDKKDKRFKQITGSSYFDRLDGRMVVSQVQDIIDQLVRQRNRTQP